ncbi:coiled-coil domain-containing protein 173-like [Polyodon spathula]|uniref:coiled-coil domain-containing protein 173-like n=1 Tax=Polyodon spathula TaxID=7913 RepID=UPI001B7E57CF|nr:coiled-coil domain-containing protein 173-like [Polyodon spathula]XP_041118718.1 coiled-coil domain-containing protein 173-like [Polyodon spathula]XP_041118719.1 coiled-coil domain-containing protein 173-like [Polyodon spathula]XP_041118720.1 coiled-coil domain-containing protein 173-like [Polyodon spathula]
MLFWTTCQTGMSSRQLKNRSMRKNKSPLIFFPQQRKNYFKKMRKEKEAELFREQLQQRDQIIELLAKQMQDEIIARAVAEQETKEERKLKEKEEKRIAELKSIATHRVTMLIVAVVIYLYISQLSSPSLIQSRCHLALVT